MGFVCMGTQYSAPIGEYLYNKSLDLGIMFESDSTAIARNSKWKQVCFSALLLVSSTMGQKVKKYNLILIQIIFLTIVKK